jgi:hypothetical protein
MHSFDGASFVLGSFLGFGCFFIVLKFGEYKIDKQNSETFERVTKNYQDRIHQLKKEIKQSDVDIKVKETLITYNEKHLADYREFAKEFYELPF